MTAPSAIDSAQERKVQARAERRAAPAIQPYRAARGLTRVLDFVSRRIVAFLIIVAVLLVATYVKFMSDLSAEGLAQLIAKDAAVGGQGNVPNETAAAIQGRLVILLVLTLPALGLAAYIIGVRIFLPLRKLILGAGEVAEGKLTVTFPSKGPEVVAQLGEALNQIAANYQEVLLLTGTTVGKLKEIAHKIDRAAHEGSPEGYNAELPGLIAQMEANLDALTEIVQSFEYFQTSFDGAKVVGDPPMPE